MFRRTLSGSEDLVVHPALFSRAREHEIRIGKILFVEQAKERTDQKRQVLPWLWGRQAQKILSCWNLITRASGGNDISVRDRAKQLSRGQRSHYYPLGRHSGFFTKLHPGKF